MSSQLYDELLIDHFYLRLWNDVRKLIKKCFIYERGIKCNRPVPISIIVTKGKKFFIPFLEKSFLGFDRRGGGVDELLALRDGIGLEERREREKMSALCDQNLARSYFRGQICMFWTENVFKLGPTFDGFILKRFEIRNRCKILSLLFHFWCRQI